MKKARDISDIDSLECSKLIDAVRSTNALPFNWPEGGLLHADEQHSRHNDVVDVVDIQRLQIAKYMVGDAVLVRANDAQRTRLVTFWIGCVTKTIGCPSGKIHVCWYQNTKDFGFYLPMINDDGKEYIDISSIQKITHINVNGKIRKSEHDKIKFFMDQWAMPSYANRDNDDNVLTQVTHAHRMIDDDGVSGLRNT
jgi:hypothetical protein